jgi:hypothetical protein
MEKKPNAEAPFEVAHPSQPEPPRKKYARKVVVQPIQYKVGVDVTTEQYTNWTLKIADWFSERKPTLKEPVKVAKRYLDCCLRGTKPREPDTIWRGAEQWSLPLRIRSACAYDVEAMKPIYSKIDRKRIRANQVKKRMVEQKVKRKTDPHLPEAVRVLARKETTYGDDPTVFLSPKEHRRWLELKEQYTKQFPELALVNAEAELNVLCDLLVLSERHRLKMLNGEKLDTKDYQQLVGTIDSIKTTLGIHPNQLAKRVQERRAGSFAELLARFEGMPNAREVRERHWIEELTQIYQMYHQPSPRNDMGGHQLDDVGLLGLTGCRTCKCAGCGMQNYAGLSIKEVERYLEAKEVLQVEAEPALAKDASEPLTEEDVASYADDPDPDVQGGWDIQLREFLKSEGLDRPDRDAPEED